MQVTLTSVLARRDQECLLSELEALQTESEVSLSTKAETQAVCGHLQNVGCFSFYREVFSTVKELCYTSCPQLQ